MNSIAFVASRRPPQVAAGRVVVHVGVDRHPIRGQTVWSIADVFGVEDQIDAMVAGTVEDDASIGQPKAAELLHDVLDSQMIAPPRPRRRRQRTVSSRAVFYQGGDRQDG